MAVGPDISNNLNVLGGLTDEQIADLFKRFQEQQQGQPPSEAAFQEELIPIGQVDTPPEIIQQIQEIADQTPTEVPAVSSPPLSNLTDSDIANLFNQAGVDFPSTNVPSTAGGETGTESTGSTGSTTAPSTTNNNQDAKEILRRTLANYKLEGLADKIWDLTQRGIILNPNDPDEIGRAVSDTPEYAARFPGNVARRNAGLPEKSLTEYIQLEQAYAGMMRGAGLPSGFYDGSDDFSKFIAGDVSLAELQTRIDDGYRAVSESNPQVIQQMKNLYGIDEGGLAAYFLDPARATPVIRRQARAAQIAAEASRQAGMQLGVGMAEDLARENITAEQAQRGFGIIATQGQLAAPLMAGEEQLTTEEQIGATFGTNVAAQQRVETRRRRRQAAFESGGGFAGMGGQRATGLTTVGE